MGEYTSRAGLYKPGGGSTGTNLPDEVVDIDKINNNMDVVDDLLGARSVPSATSYSGDFPGDLVFAEDTRQLYINLPGEGLQPLRVGGGRTFRGSKALMEAFAPKAMPDDIWEVPGTGSKYKFINNEWQLSEGYGAWQLVSGRANSTSWSPMYGANATWGKLGGEFEFVSDSASNSGVKVPAKGLYRVTVTLYVGTVGLWMIGAKLNDAASSAAGLRLGNSLQNASPAGSLALSASRVLSMNKDDRIMPVVWTSGTAGPYGLSAEGTSLTVEKLFGDSIV